MLLTFRVANHRSLRNQHDISFVAGVDQGADAVPRQGAGPHTEPEFDPTTHVVRATGVKVDGKEIGVLPAIGVFGANASGKSNVLHALRAMREAVRTSVTGWAAQGSGVPREPFALDPACREQTSLFEVELLLGKRRVRYTYGFELSDQRVEAEWLHAYPNGRRQVWFDREADREDGGPEFRFPGEGLRGGKDQLVELTRPNALFLTVGASFNHPQLGAVHRWFLDNLWLVSSGSDLARRIHYTRTLLTDLQRPEFRDQVLALLRVADLGITGLLVDPSRPADQQIQLLHGGGSREPVPLGFIDQESLGTHAWFAFLGPLLRVLDQGTVLLADELDSSLHPVLAAEVIRLFQDRAANPNGAQLLFTTHDATLLGSGTTVRPLGRDQVWITTKRVTGETELYPLTDAHPRKEDNLERGYLCGRYGGVPQVSVGEIAREVGHVLARTG